ICLSDDGGRAQKLLAGGKVLHETIHLPQNNPLTVTSVLPPETYHDGSVTIELTPVAGPNAVVSNIQLWSTEKSLGPHFHIAASGGLDGKIEGVVSDLNRSGVLAPLNIRIKPSDPAWKGGQIEQVVSDPSGKFTVQIPAEWNRSGLNSVAVTAFSGSVQKILFVPMAEIFLPRLTPVPAEMPGTDVIKMDLNGLWKFNPVPQGDFWCDEQPAGRWYDIQVPGEWVMQGFSVPEGAAAAYRRTFTVPADWKSAQIKLRCDAVYSDATVWINGKEAGAHRVGFTPFEIDVTDYLLPGRQNQIALAVKNESLADVLASGSQYAVHQLGGITRNIYLFAVPKLNIAAVDVETAFDGDYRNAVLKVCVDVVNQTGKPVNNARIALNLEEWQTKKGVAVKPGTYTLPEVGPRGCLRHIIEIGIDNPNKWDSEHPNLYLLTCRLMQGSKNLESVTRRFGFRQIEVRGNQLFVNNNPVKLHGVNRHEVHPLTGRSLVSQEWRKDAELFRAANCNYIRTSHYPPAEEFIDICDEMGLFVEEEAPLCWVGHGANKTWQVQEPHAVSNLQTILDGTLTMIQRDRSHPSVIIWSLANESAWGPNFIRSFELANIADPTRPKSFHDQSWGQFNSYGSTAQIANYHYPGPVGPERAAGSERPLLFGEYCHLNSYNRYELAADPGVRDMWGIGFKAMWDEMYAAKGCLGGAIWSGIDDTFYLPNGKTVGYGAWGPLDGWRREKPEYWHVKKTYSPVRVLTESIAPASGPIKLDIENRHDFTNLGELRIEWTLAGKSGTAKADLPPRSKGQLLIDTDTANAAGQTLSLTFHSPRGFVVDTYMLPIGEQTPSLPPAKTAGGSDIELEMTEEAINVRGEGFKWVISRLSGLVSVAAFANTEAVVGGPHLMVLPLNNAGGTQMTGNDEFAPYTDICPGWKASEVKAERVNEGVQISVAGRYEQFTGSYKMFIDRAGRLSVDYEFVSATDVNPRQVGLVFDLPRSFDVLKWQRKGLWNVYPHDHIGRLSGSARAFDGIQTCGSVGVRYKPLWPWSSDCTEYGSNDFRSTKAGIYYAAVTDSGGKGVGVRSDGSQSVRVWVDKRVNRILVADYSNAGAEGFFRSHAGVLDRPVKKDQAIKGCIRLESAAGE
ncbi:MAG: hypothetical protein L0Y36_01430, partial [Planctomycetales bacterium]|nr:hypothetical protein [Planctomycetales bacterium]